MRASFLCLVSLLVLLGPAVVSAQETAADELAPPADAAPQVEATVTVTTTSEVAAQPVPAPPVVAVPPPPATYAPQAPIAYVPAPARDPSTRPSFGPSVALHVTAAIAGPLGLAGLVIGALTAIVCGSSSCGTTGAAFAIAGGVLESASLAIGISATAVHGWTRARVREWEAGTARVLPWGSPSGGGAVLTLTF